METETVVSSCDWESAKLLIFSNNVEVLTYYTHLLPLVVSLLLGGFILYNNRRALVNQVLFFIALMFSVWTYFDLILWASPSPEHVMFFWSSIVPVEMLIYAGCLYLVAVLANRQQDISLPYKVAISVLFIPIILFTHTPYNVLGLSPDCDEGAIEGALIQYMYVVEIFLIIVIAAITALGLKLLPTKTERLQLLFIGVGTVLFLLTFTAGNLTLVFEFPPDWEQYKLLGMPIFAAFVAYCVVRFKSFNSKAIATEVLVVALAVATLSLLFLRQIGTVRVIAGVTFILVCILGYLLVRSVRREVEQREKIEVLAKELEEANAQQVTLIHFITHQIKGFVTKSRNIFSMALEGDFGDVNGKLRPMLQEGFDSDTKGTQVIQEILNAANIKSGKVTFTMAPFDLRELIQEIGSDLRTAAEAKGLALTLALGDTPATITGDKMQLVNVFRNLIDNSIKYTPSGKVDVAIEKHGGKVLFSIKDTGVGITPEDMKCLFTEGGHGKESTKVNVESTGFGLYIVKNIVDAHKGRVWAESEGEGKGSQFYVEIPEK